MQRQDIEEKLIAKAQANPTFRQALLSNPKAEIEKELGVALPKELEVKVVEETSSILYLVLPAAEGELAEADLARVAGGAALPYIEQDNLLRKK